MRSDKAVTVDSHRLREATHGRAGKVRRPAHDTTGEPRPQEKSLLQGSPLSEGQQRTAVVEVVGGCAEVSYEAPGVHVKVVDHDELKARLRDGDEEYVIDTIKQTPELDWASDRYDYSRALKRRAGIDLAE